MRHTEEVGGRREEVRRGTRDGWVETYGTRENERCTYER